MVPPGTAACLVGKRGKQPPLTNQGLKGDTQMTDHIAQDAKDVLVNDRVRLST